MTIKTAVCFSAMIVMVLWCNQGAVAQSVSQPSGELTDTEADDIRPANERSSFFNEAWVYHIYLDDGTQLYLSYMLANFGTFMSAVSGGRLSVIDFDGEYYQVARQYDLDELQLEEENHRMQLRPGRNIWFEGSLPDTHRVRYETSKDGVSYDLDLKFADIQQGKRWGDGNFKADGEDISIQMHIPYSRVEGRLRINDTEKQVSGTAYMDHTYQSTITPRVLSSGYRYIYHGDKNDYEIGYTLIPEDKQSTENIVGHALIKNSEGITLKKPEKLERGDKIDFQGGRVPEKLRFRYNPSGTTRIEVTEGRERLSFLSEVGGLRKRIARSYLRGEVINYRGVGRLNGDKRIFLNYFLVE